MGGVKLIVGLGNPGLKYRDTRHNVGFEVVDEVARRFQLAFESSPVDAVMARQRGAEARLMLAKPATYMNLSGAAVAGLARYYRVEAGDLLVVVDDTNLTLGRLRARPGGSEGGHNGLKSVVAELGSREFARLRLGVGRGDVRRDLASHVLARFDEAERGTVAEMVSRAADAVEVFVEEGIEAVMNRFNADTAEEPSPSPS
jgi:PTH1 family peptidyl-tRNA hydrolase